MVAITLLLMIVTGLTQVFLQTQKAFKGGLGQVDILESGRAAMDMISRDLEQMAPSGDTANTNFYLEMPYPWRSSLVKPTIIPNTADTNFLRNFFVLTHGSSWQGVSYEVLDSNFGITNAANVIVGSLYRNSRTNCVNRIQGAYLSTNFETAIIYPTNYHRVIDGVVRLNVRVYMRTNTSALEVIPNNGTTNYDIILNPLATSFLGGCYLGTYTFRKNEVPGFIDVELGILDPAAVALLKAITDPGDPNYYTKQKNFVETNAGKIHIFRQQIPIRSISR